MDWLVILLAPIVGYLIGSIPFGYLVARARGVDIFKEGSGNIGATNVGRTLGRPYGVLVFVLDFAKGALPVLAARQLASYWPGGWLETATGLATFLGHLFPLYLGLRGGKGVATGTGVVLVLVPGPALAALIVWLIAVLATRYVSLGSVLAVLALATAQLVASRSFSDPRSIFCLFAGALVIVKHRSNLVRLVEGRENQTRESPAMNALTKISHVLAVAVWLGSAVFFSFIVGPVMFSSFEQLGEQAPQPPWFQRMPWYNHTDDAINGPREQGVRAAGYAIAPMFAWYFLLQGVRGLVALGTSLAWVGRGGIHRARLSLLLTAMLLVIGGWALERYVHDLRDPRNRATEAYLLSPDDTTLRNMRSARAAFGMWHGISVLVNYAVIACVAGAAGLAAFLPAEAVARPMPSKEAMSPTPEPIAGS